MFMGIFYEQALCNILSVFILLNMGVIYIKDYYYSVLDYFPLLVMFFVD